MQVLWVLGGARLTRCKQNQNNRTPVVTDGWLLPPRNSYEVSGRADSRVGRLWEWNRAALPFWE